MSFSVLPMLNVCHILTELFLFLAFPITLKSDIHKYFDIKDCINMCVIRELTLNLYTKLPVHGDPVPLISSLIFSFCP